MQLVDYKPYVELEHKPVSSIEEAIDLLKDSFDNQTIDFIDGILFSPSSGVILTGRLISTPSSRIPTHRFTRSHDQHFYRHCEKLLRSSSRNKFKQPITEAIPTRDYIFRYDRGAFWGAKHAFRYFHVPFNRITRFMLNPFMHASVMFHALHESGLAAKAIIQDVSFPVENTPEFISYVGSTMDCYPLWLCPLRPTSAEKLVANKDVGRAFGMGRDTPMDSRFVNVGVWCVAPKQSASEAEFVQLNREIESKVHKLQGLKALYAHTYYTEDEFWQVYDKEQYDALRVKYRATGMPSVYDKVKVTAKEETEKGAADASSRQKLVGRCKARLKDSIFISGVYGVLKTVVSKEYLLKDKGR